MATHGNRAHRRRHRSGYDCALMAPSKFPGLMYLAGVLRRSRRIGRRNAGAEPARSPRSAHQTSPFAITIRSFPGYDATRPRQIHFPLAPEALADAIQGLGHGLGRMARDIFIQRPGINLVPADLQPLSQHLRAGEDSIRKGNRSFHAETIAPAAWRSREPGKTPVFDRHFKGLRPRPIRRERMFPGQRAVPDFVQADWDFYCQAIMV